ncbi:MAG: DUF600 family protein [Ardenticatenales bacterium]|nr:DUF600 family protein [Ardenticatenales bacterium]
MTIDFNQVERYSKEEIYEAIGLMIGEAIIAEGDDWQTAILVAEIEDELSGLTYGRYTTKIEQEHQKSFSTGYHTYVLFNELRRRMKQPDQPAWNKATFRLQPNGEFECSFSYPDESGGEAVAGEVAGLDAIEYVPPEPTFKLPADPTALSEDELYEWLVQGVKHAVKEPWETAFLRGEVANGRDGQAGLWFRSSAETGELGSAPPADPHQTLRYFFELWRRAARAGEPWSELTVQVTPDGGVRRIYVSPESPVPAELTQATNAQLIDWLREMTEAMIDAPWVRAVAVGRFEEPPQHGGSAVFFHPASAPEAEWATLASGNHNRLFVELWRRWKARGKDWSELQFHLQPDGSYEFEGVLR